MVGYGEDINGNLFVKVMPFDPNMGYDRELAIVKHFEFSRSYGYRFLGWYEGEFTKLSNIELVNLILNR